MDHQIVESLSLKKHVSIVSLDFQRAFDRIGLHTIIDQLIVWNVGPKIINYIKNFMSNRKFMVKITSNYSQPFPLHNGIPQGSPLSVVLFLIAYNKLCHIISLHREIDFTSYADDFNLIIKSNKEKNPVINLNNLFNDITDWTNYLGAVLSPNKCKYIHICRKRNCRCEIISNHILLSEVKNLRLLGLYFNNRYRWNEHIDNLVKSLKQQLNIIKCLSSPKFNCSTSTLIQITKALILSKVNYGLPIFGYTSESLLKKVNKQINAALRSSLGAFRTTRTKNLFSEAKILPLEVQRDILTTKLHHALSDKDSPLAKITTKIKKSKKVPKILSTIRRIQQNCKTIDIPIQTPRNKNNYSPPWHLHNNNIDLSLHNFAKNNHNPIQFRTMFNEIQNNLSNYNFIYTDGSKNNNNVGYSVTTENTVIKLGALPDHSSILTAELIAINIAVSYIGIKRGKYAICTDSLSSLKAILNITNNNIYASNIRDFLIKRTTDIKLIWVPSHINIPGNEFADTAAKLSLRSPVLKTENHNIKDIHKHITTFFKNKDTTYSQTSNWYKTINNNSESTTIISSNITRLDSIKITRLRLGHTKLTHGCLLKIPVTYPCDCNIIYPTNPSHMLLDCALYHNQRQLILKSQDPIQLLADPSEENISTIINYLKSTNLYNLI